VSDSVAAHPTAEALCGLALPRFLREETQRPEELVPLYLRDVDARISWHGRGALFGGRPGAMTVADEGARR